MPTKRIKLVGEVQRRFAHDAIDAAPDGAVVSIADAETSRTSQQNRLVHRWFADIARALGDQSEADIKIDCNLQYGRPILARDDEEWSAAFAYIFDALSLPAKRKAIRVFDIPFTRRMSVAQLSEYMAEMQRDYLAQGVYLTDPDQLGRHWH